MYVEEEQYHFYKNGYYFGMSMGAETAFMITGPGTKVTNLGALKIVLGIKNFIIYLAYVIVFACVSGLLIDFIGLTIWKILNNRARGEYVTVSENVKKIDEYKHCLIMCNQIEIPINEIIEILI